MSRVLQINLIQYLLGGTVSYNTALGTHKRTSRVCHLEALGRELTGSVVCSTMRCLLLPSNAHAAPPPSGYIIHIACQSCAIQLMQPSPSGLVLYKPYGTDCHAISITSHMTFHVNICACALLGSNRQRIVEQTTIPVNTCPSTS